MSQMPSEERLRALKGQKISVSELLALFGTRVRNDQSVLLIKQALNDTGLSTLPYFATCSQSTYVHVVAAETATEAEPEAADVDEDTDALAPGALPQHPVRIGEIPAAQSGVESVTSTTQLTEATYLMRTKNYSQLPVMDDQRTLTGVITWHSVALMYAQQLEPTLANALVDTPSVAETHQDFFSLLPMVRENGYLLVRGSDGRFTGIVTDADITERFEATAWPFFVVGEIEFRLRRCLGAALDPDAIRAAQPNRPERQTGLITDLMFGDYVKLLDGDPRGGNQRVMDRCARADQNWQALGWTGVDRVQFVHQLDRVRQIRNKIAHFDPDPLPQQLSQDLRQFAALLRQLV